jgi:DEAD/DEAH box helicase domain-containing protein
MTFVSPVADNGWRRFSRGPMLGAEEAVSANPDHRPGSGTALARVLARWRGGDLPGELCADLTALPQGEDAAPFPGGIGAALRAALTEQGVARPWRHQAEAWDLLGRGIDTVIATPTASGKTLCYNVPVLERLGRDPAARAIYLFPTKALARDQEAAVADLARRAGIDARPVVYDGDTPAGRRRAAREEARVLITNPDMLHTGILPHHPSWAALFAGLSHVVIDELHQYRGVFGSHVANVLRRLLRVAAFHGSAPVFAACSATIANPGELAGRLAGRPFAVIGESGAPAGPRTFVVVNPRLVDPALNLRLSALRVASRLAGDLVEAGVTTLVFCQTRRGVELALRYLRGRVRLAGGDPERVRGYRGGYLPLLRREIEGDLRAGRLHAVVATNALELGIDVGELHAVVLAGYPGTIASLRQRAGRAGRRRAPSLAVLVARNEPLDQYLARRPEYLVEASPERALVEPDNVGILLDHLGCAAFELPFAAGEGFGTLAPEDTAAALACLVEGGTLERSGGKVHWIDASYPAARVGLRGAGADRVVVLDAETGEALAEIDPAAARRELHPEAIYQHEGGTWFVEALDLEAREARVRPARVDHTTVPVTAVTLDLLEQREGRAAGPARLGFGDVRVSESVTAYKKIRFRTGENLGYGPVDLPPIEMETEAVWLAFPADAFVEASGIGGPALRPGLEGLAAALRQVASLRLMCDPRDLGLAIQEEPRADGAPAGDAAESSRPAIHLYDVPAGGVGLCDRIFREAGVLIEDAARLIAGCPCRAGCPSCVGPGPEEIDGSPPPKAVAARLAAWFLGREVIA